jgi:bacillithiol synthase
MFAARAIPYQKTGSFTKIVVDYLNGNEELSQFFASPPTIEGIQKTIELKKSQPVDRELLVKVLRDQYKPVEAKEKVKSNIESLLSSSTFTITTAHQPNLFTGPLYFIYKILHAIKLADELSGAMPQYHFVPVYYMGSEDADFAELNHTYVAGKKLEWKKEQTGAVGRMKVDKTLIQLIDELEGQLSVEEKGKEVIGMLRRCYSNGRTIQDATFELVNELYGAYGLIVLIPDNSLLKAQMKKVFEEDIFSNRPSSIVQETSEKLGTFYDVQAHPREINLFYLENDVRERIEKRGDEFAVLNTGIVFSAEEIRKELQEHPERFSPNVILRGLYQETILPNIAFIGGGGELAYWLQLRSLFDHYQVVYPVLVLRNSFLVVEKKWSDKIRRLDLDLTDLFLPLNDLMTRIVKSQSVNQVSLNGNFEKAVDLFEQIKTQAGAIDQTLTQHVTAIKAKALKTLQELEKKMLRAEKRKFSDQQNQVGKIREALFPRDGLQERVENFSSFYAKWGQEFIEALYKNSTGLRQEFVILSQV